MRWPKIFSKVRGVGKRKRTKNNDEMTKEKGKARLYGALLTPADAFLSFFTR